jgi:hypothetical protein
MLDARNVSPGLLMQLSFGRWVGDLPVDAFHSLLRRVVRDKPLHRAAVSLLHRRLGNPPRGVDVFLSEARELAVNGELIRDDHGTSYAWSQIAKELVSLGYVEEISTAIISQHLEKSGDRTWFIEYSGGAKEVLKLCLDADSAAVWRSIKARLETPDGWYSFTVGFPKGMIDKLSVDPVLDWVAEAPSERAIAIARLSGFDLESGSSLASRVLDRFGSDDVVASSLFSQYISRSFSGPSHEYWRSLAEALREASSKNPSVAVKRWVRKAAQWLEEMAAQEQEHEEERKLRGA